jgi:hypothetical protein
MWSGEVAGRSRKEREEWWCEGIDEAMPPFIGERVCCGAGWRSTMARRFRRLVELGEVMALLYMSRRG